LATRTVRKVTPTGQVTTLAGTGRGASPPADGVGTLASFGAPEGVAFDASTGSLLVVDEKNNMLRRVSLAGVVSFVAGNVSGGYADGVGAAASFRQPSGVDVDGASGMAYVADLANHRIRRVDASGTVTTLAGGFLGGTWPEAVDGVGTAARFFRPMDLASDGAGGLYVSDWGNGLIRRVDLKNGRVTTVAGNCGSGRIPFNTQSLNDNTCYGNLTDGVGTAAVLNHPSGLVFSPPSTLYFTDSQNNAIRSLDVLTREVKTLTGRGGVGYADGQCTAALFNTPMDLVVDANGNLIVASFENNAIRTITLSPQPPPPPIASPPPPLPPPQPPSAPQAPQAGGVLPPTGLSFPASVGISAMVLTCSLIASLYLCLKKPALRKSSARRAYAPLGSFGEDAPRSGWADPYEPPSPLREAVPRRRHTFREQLLDFIAEVASPRASDAEAAARPQTRREQLMQYVAEMSSPRAADAASPRPQTRREQLMEYAAEAGTPRTESGTPRVEAGTPRAESGTPRVEAGTPRAAASPRPSRFDLLMEYAAEAGTPRAAMSPRPTRFDQLMEFAAGASTPRGSAPPTPTAAVAELELAARPGSRAQFLPDEPEPALAVTRRQALLQLAAREENMAQFDRPLGLRRIATHAAVAASAVDVEAPSATPRSAVSATPRSAMSETPWSEMSGTPRSPLDPRAAGMDLRQFLRSLSALASEAVDWTGPSPAATPRGEGGLDRNHAF